MRTLAFLVLAWTALSLTVSSLWAGLRWAPVRQTQRAPVGGTDVPAQRPTVDRPAHRV